MDLYKLGYKQHTRTDAEGYIEKLNAVLVFVNPLYVVEQSFGTLHRKFRYARAAYFGLIKVSAQSHLKAMCLNLLKAANKLSAPAAA
ncbi:truncated ISNme1 transposase [Neisseria meningitidis]|nr:truncated ISNme1 transposase [Neisseria meningitidis]